MKKGLVTELSDFSASCDLETLMEASRIRRDDKRLKAAIAAGRERLDGLMKIVSDEDNDED